MSELADGLDQVANEDPTVVIDWLAEKSAGPCALAKLATAGMYAESAISVYYNPCTEKVALFTENVNGDEFTNYVRVLSDVFGKEAVADFPLHPDELNDYQVKIAYSPTLRTVGEVLQFFPSSYTGDLGGRPLMSMLASGLVGAGLGYGAGTLTESMAPDGYKKKGRLGNTGAIIGGLTGAGIGSMPGFYNMMAGKSFFDTPSYALPLKEAQALLPELGSVMQGAIDRIFEGSEKVAFGSMAPMDGPPIRVNELGQVLWGSNANPQTTAMTMGLVHGASRFPDPSARPGSVSPKQVGLLGLAMGAAGGGLGGYLLGNTVGKTLGLLTGLPQDKQDMLVNSGVALGVINSVVPKLFGR